MFERFTEPARQVVVLGQDEARRLRHNYIGTEHLLLGLLREEDGIGRRVLASFGVALDDAKKQVIRYVGEGDTTVTGQIPFTPRAKKVLELALREALSLGHNYVGTEHILLGLVRENEGVGARILFDAEADAEAIRAEVIRAVGEPQPPRRPGERRGPVGWEYRVESLGDEPTEWVEQFEALGNDGWELTAVVERNAIFKRRRRSAVVSVGSASARDN